MKLDNEKGVMDFFEAVLSLKDKEECTAFFSDICTIKELLDFGQRMEVATALSKGMNYQEISEKTGASSATISRVNRCLMYGEGGYRTVLDRLDKENK
ncbi:MAG: YerC/YecD family TrpR-related protein [Candidatus Ornithospirochaeta sp.]